MCINYYTKQGCKPRIKVYTIPCKAMENLQTKRTMERSGFTLTQQIVMPYWAELVLDHWKYRRDHGIS